MKKISNKIYRHYKYLFILAGLLFTTVALAAESYVLKANEWAVPRQATTLLNMPAIHQTMSVLSNNPASYLILKYPGGDEGTLWVNELRSWLIALGLSSRRIETEPGSAISTSITLEVIHSHP